MDGCIFCMICEGKIPSKKAYEDDKILAFYDINPQAPVHILVIPKEHIGSADEITPENSGIISYIFENIPKIAKAAGLTGGYRIISNCAPDARQSVHHLHFHILGGRKLPENMKPKRKARPFIDDAIREIETCVTNSESSFMKKLHSEIVK